jgi:hypothetical protein
MPALPKEAVGAVVAAIIAGLVAFYSLIISKEQTISGFRQQWIDALRADVAALVACVVGVYGDSIAKKGGNEDLWGKVKEQFTRFQELETRIKLRLNPQEERKKYQEAGATKAVLAAIEKLDAIFRSPKPAFDEIPESISRLVNNTQAILRANWKRVRAGETVFRVSKWAALVIAVLALVALALHGFRVI